MQEITPLLLLGFLFVANSLWIIGFWLLFEDGFLLGKVAKWVTTARPTKSAKTKIKQRTAEIEEYKKKLKEVDPCLDDDKYDGYQRAIAGREKLIKKIRKEESIPILPAFIRKPLYQCPFCMSSVHGSAWYLIADLGPWYYLPVYCVALCGAIVVLMWGRVE